MENEKANTANFDLNELADKWSSKIVARTDQALRDFSGGTLPGARRMANLDSTGEGPPRIRIGKTVAYPVDTLIDWMKTRSYDAPKDRLRRNEREAS